MKRKKKKSSKLTSKALSIVHENGFMKVTDVVDADDIFEADVSVNDVKMGARKEHRICPMATACKRKTHQGVIISLSTAYLIKGNTAIRYRVTGPLRTEIVSFDRFGKFEPGTYELAPPPESHRIGAKHYGSKTSGSSKRGGKSRKRWHLTPDVRSVLGSFHAQVVK